MRSKEEIINLLLIQNNRLYKSMLDLEKMKEEIEENARRLEESRELYNTLLEEANNLQMELDFIKSKFAHEVITIRINL